MKLFRHLVLLPVYLYRYGISPALGPPRCRFHPSCSAYMVEAVKTHGVFKGLYMGVRRVLRCHPWHPGGYDPVPPVAAQQSCGCASQQKP